MTGSNISDAGATDTRSQQSTAQPKVPCPHCGKRLRDENGVRTHIIAKHGGKGRGAYKPTPPDDDESFADRAVQAEIDRACGIPNGDIDWLLP